MTPTQVLFHLCTQPFIILSLRNWFSVAVPRHDRRKLFAFLSPWAVSPTWTISSHGGHWKNVTNNDNHELNLELVAFKGNCFFWLFQSYFQNFLLSSLRIVREFRNHFVLLPIIILSDCSLKQSLNSFSFWLQWSSLDLFKNTNINTT